MNLTCSGKLAAGSAAIAACRGFKGAALYDAAGGGSITVWKGVDDTGAELCKVGAVDQQPSCSMLLPGECVIPTPLGIYYTAVGDGAYIYYEAGA